MPRCCHLKISNHRLIALVLFCTFFTIVNVLIFKCYEHSPKLPVSENESHGRNHHAVIDARRWLRSQNFTEVGSIPCLWTAIEDIQFPICTYNNDDDIYVSAAVYRGQIYEHEVVERVVRLLRTQFSETVQLVDIGANIGSYTLPVSTITSVIAVEPNWETMYRLAMSVLLGGVERNVTLVYSAVDNQRTVINMAYSQRNRGITVLSKNSSCAGVSRKGLKCLHRPIESVILDDLVPLMKYRRAILKVDVEGHEVNVFTEVTAAAFFRAIDVPLILMEWVVLLGPSRNEPNYVQRVETLLTFFRRRDYLIYNHKNELLPSNWRRWPGNILLKKRQFVDEVF